MSLHRTLLETLAVDHIESSVTTWLDEALQTCVEQNHLYVTVSDEALMKQLQQLPIVGHASDGMKPWILEKSNEPKLYLGRYWFEKQSYLTALHARTDSSKVMPTETIDNDGLLSQLDTDQRTALEGVLNAPFGLVTGGPGSGKTYFSMALIQAYFLKYPQASIGICAPTGKAVRRIKEALGARGLIESNRIEIGTVHQLLRSSVDFNRAPSPLAYNLLVVDEVSMLSGVMAEQLLMASQHVTHMVWLGDVNQLPSVEAGEVVADVLAHLPQCIHYLSAQHRYDSDSHIATLAVACLSGVWSKLEQALNTRTVEMGQPALDLLLAKMDQRMQQWQDWAKQAQWQSILQNLSEWIVLNPQRQGLEGIQTFNKQLTQRYQAQGIKPIIIRKNQPQFNVFNGDMGILVASEGLIYYLNESQTVATQPAANMVYDDAWMLTVHQAQGSEFQTVWLWIGESTNANLLTSKLLYTAITRAKADIKILTDINKLRMVLQNEFV